MHNEMAMQRIHEILRDTPLYQEILREGREQGSTKGRHEGRIEGYTEGFHTGQREGQFKAQRRAILSIVQERFPKLELLAKKQVAMNSEGERLNTLIVQLSIARDEREATRLLFIDDSNSTQGSETSES